MARGKKPATESKAIVGIDPGTACGYAVVGIEDGTVDLVQSGVWNLSRRKHEGGGMQMVRLGANMIRSLTQLCVDFDKVYLVYEEIRFHGRNAGIDAAHLYGAIVGQLTAACEVHDVPYKGMYPSTARKIGAGKGNFKKPQVREVMEEFFGVELSAGDKKPRKVGAIRGKAKLGYDESDAVVLALAFAREMGWAK